MPSTSPSPGGSSSGSSATPPPQIISSKKKSKTSKPTQDLKGKKKSTSTADQARNEGVNPNWDYTPPPGAVLIDDKDGDAGDFDWDVINNDDDLELCLVRIPDSVKLKHLENLKIDLPSPSTSKSSCIGTLKRKHATFDVWSVGSDGNLPIGGEEIKGISCLLPRKSKKGKLYPAPRPIAHHFVLSAQPVVPTPPGEEEDTAIRFTNPPRQLYPKDVLKHRFMPYGSLVNVTNANPVEDNEDDANLMDVDGDAAQEVFIEEVAAQTSTPKKEKKKKGKVIEVVDGEDEPESTPAKKGKKRKADEGAVSETPAAKKTKTKKVLHPNPITK